MRPDVVVIGGGAAGIFAAWNAASHGARTLLIEKTDKLGTKIKISGGGKCNVAHDGPLEDVLGAFRRREARFIRPACYRLPNDAIIQHFQERGLEVYTREDGRVFPVHQTAKDVVAILRRNLDEAGVEVWTDTPVLGLVVEDGRMVGVRTADSEVLCERVVVAVGGKSYPKTGSTGDGYAWLREVGHTVVPIRAALAPMYLELDGMAERAGIALRDVTLKARLAGKEIARWRHDLLFTHRGVSGPCALGISREVDERFGDGTIALEVDVAPNDTFETLSGRLRDWTSANRTKKLGGFLDMLPERLRGDLLNDAKIPDGSTQSVPKKALNRLVETLKGWPLGPVRSVPVERGEVVAGGVALDEVDPHTMRSSKVEGLFLCGEILDVAGPVGGYNLQAAFATGYVAGESAATDATSHSPAR